MYDGSNLTFYDTGNFSWKDPIFGSRDFNGTWKNIGNKTHRAYSLLYIDPVTGVPLQKNFTFVRGYYHTDREIVFTYPCFIFDGSINGHFYNPYITNKDYQSIPVKPTIMPPPHLPEPGKDVIIGAWRRDSWKQFDWYRVFNADGTYYSISGGIRDEPGSWTNVSEFRYKVLLPYGQSLYVGYRNGTIYNENSPDGTFSWAGYSPILPF